MEFPDNLSTGDNVGEVDIFEQGIIDEIRPWFGGRLDAEKVHILGSLIIVIDLVWSSLMSSFDRGNSSMEDVLELGEGGWLECDVL